MDRADVSGMPEWVARWKKAGPRLDAIRAREIEQTTLPQFIASMNDAFQAARPTATTTTSGLVIQQRLFARLRA